MRDVIRCVPLYAIIGGAIMAAAGVLVATLGADTVSAISGYAAAFTVGAIAGAYVGARLP